MGEHNRAHGLWSLVFINSAVFILFAVRFFKQRTRRDWRSFGAVSAFLMALVAILFGFVIQWPTGLTLAMSAILVLMYWRLTLSEEGQAEEEPGEEYHRYSTRTPAFIPSLSAATRAAAV